MNFPLPIVLVLVVPVALTVLAWITGLRVIATHEAAVKVRTRTWPAMLFLAGPFLMTLGFLALPQVPASLPAREWMFLIGAASSVAALVSSAWASPRFRALALFAALSWVVCFGLG